MRRWHFYNDISEEACAWTRELIKLRLIPDGEVDNRSICDVQPSDLAGYIQCHWFNGISGWARAARLAGFPEDRPAWFASLPCQPWSAAGAGKGHGDDRHLAPVFLKLVEACQPPLIFGEQVSSAAVVGRSNSAGRRKVQGEEPPPWFSGIRADLERARYAVCGLDIPAACVGEDCEIGLLRGDQVHWERGRIGPPHIRQRLYWAAVRGANAEGGGLRIDGSASRGAGHLDERGTVGGLSDTHAGQCAGKPDGQRRQLNGPQAGRQQGDREFESSGSNDFRMGQPEGQQPHGSRDARGGRGEPSDDGDSRRILDVQQGLEGHPGYGDDRDEPGWKLADETGPVATASGVADRGISDVPSDRLQGCRQPGGTDEGRQGENYRGQRPSDNSHLNGGLPYTNGRDSGAEREQRFQQDDGHNVRPWPDFNLVPCLDNKARRLEPGTQPLVASLPRGVVPSGDPGAPGYAENTAEARRMRLSGYGNAICPELAEEFIRTCMEVIDA